MGCTRARASSREPRRPKQGTWYILWVEGKDLQEAICTGSGTYKRQVTKGGRKVQEASYTGARIYKRLVTRGIGSTRGKFDGGWDQFHGGIGSMRG